MWRRPYKSVPLSKTLACRRKSVVGSVFRVSGDHPPTTLNPQPETLNPTTCWLPTEIQACATGKSWRGALQLLSDMHREEL